MDATKEDGFDSELGHRRFRFLPRLLEVHPSTLLWTKQVPIQEQEASAETNARGGHRDLGQLHSVWMMLRGALTTPV
jgi:hypothetical protein